MMLSTERKGRRGYVTAQQGGGGEDGAAEAAARGRRAQAVVWKF